MVVTWTPPTNDGGSVIEGYWLEVRDSETARWRKVSRNPISENAKTGGCTYKVVLKNFFFLTKLS